MKIRTPQSSEMGSFFFNTEIEFSRTNASLQDSDLRLHLLICAAAAAAVTVDSAAAL